MPEGEGDGKPKEADGPKPLPGTAELIASADRIRETAKWMVATFGAVAGVLVAGLQLSDIGGLEGSDRNIAVAGSVIAIGAVIAIIYITAAVLARGRVARSDLAAGPRQNRRLVRELERSKGLYMPYESIPDFVAAVEQQWTKQVESWSRLHSATDKAAQDNAKADFTATKAVLPELNRRMSQLLGIARVEDVKLAFERTRKWTAALAVIAAIGAAAFSYVNVAPDEKSEKALPQSPVVALADLSGAGKNVLQGVAGEKCDLDALEVVTLSASAGGWEAVILPVDGCETARVVIPFTQGELEPLGDDVSLDLPEE